MKASKIWRGTLVMVVFAAACSGAESAKEAESQEWTLDRRSWHIGAITAMSEMVDYGVKKLALSATLPPDEMDEFVDYAIDAAAAYNVEVFRESDFLVTDLFSAELTEGKDVLLICHESTFHEYEALKADKQRLVDMGEYQGDARTEIARRFGRLLSYPETTIELELTK